LLSGGGKLVQSGGGFVNVETGDHSDVLGGLTLGIVEDYRDRKLHTQRRNRRALAKIVSAEKTRVSGNYPVWLCSLEISFEIN
ncbi:hypothetical protein U1Q18_039796, partial [Sarracenia purpurea var. burkii]